MDEINRKPNHTVVIRFSRKYLENERVPPRSRCEPHRISGTDSVYAWPHIIYRQDQSVFRSDKILLEHNGNSTYYIASLTLYEYIRRVRGSRQPHARPGRSAGENIDKSRACRRIYWNSVVCRTRAALAGRSIACVYNNGNAARPGPNTTP